MSDLKTKLAEASEKAVTQRKERRARVVKGSHLVEQLVQLAKDKDLSIRENTGFYVVSGPAGKNVRIAIAKRGGIIDFLAFTVDVQAVRQVTKEEAEAKHLGRVQGRIAFDGTDEETLEAYRAALEVLLVPEPPKAKPVRIPKVPRVAKAKPEANVHSTNVAD